MKSFSLSSTVQKTVRRKMLRTFTFFLLLLIAPCFSALAVPLLDGAGERTQDVVLAPSSTPDMGGSRSSQLDNRATSILVDELDLGIGKVVGGSGHIESIEDAEQSLEHLGEGVVSFEYDQKQSSAFMLSREGIRELGQERWEETQVSTINLITFLLVSGAVFFMALLFFFSRHTFNLLRQNCRRLDMTVSTNRTVGEIRFVLVLISGLLIYVALYAGMIGGSVWLVDAMVIPLDFLGRIFSVFHLNPITWEFAIREQVYDDVGTLYEVWCQTRGYSAKTYTFLLELLWRNGFLLLGMTTLTLTIVSGLGIFVIRRILFLLNSFQKSAEKRRFRYDRYDRKQVVQESP